VRWVAGEYVYLLTKDGEQDKCVGAVAKDGEWFKVVEAVVDIGAEESVALPGMFPSPVTPSKMSKAGGKYRAANGARIPNLGQQKVPFINPDGDKCGIVSQVAEVERQLISASQLAASGTNVVIDRAGGRIVNETTGRTMRLAHRGGVYVLKMRVLVDNGPCFPGPGK
jgi:hypothetical protein